MSTSTAQIAHVSLNKKANIYFDGKCISHSFQLADGSRKSAGVILPTASPLRFNTDAAEMMEGVSGSCRVKLAGAADWQDYGEGQSFHIPAHSSFEIACAEPYHYICHFA